MQNQKQNTTNLSNQTYELPYNQSKKPISGWNIFWCLIITLVLIIVLFLIFQCYCNNSLMSIVGIKNGMF